MALPPPVYDLVLLLDSTIDEERRHTILVNVEDLILERGEVVDRQEWGLRPLAYEIRKRPDAEYHLLQFHADRELLETLDRTLHITDGVVRFRIIKLRPGTRAAPEQRARAGVDA
jgi:small subunit ribosomal protein S6